MNNEENYKNKVKFKKNAHWRFVKIKYKECSPQDQEVTEPKTTIALQMGTNFHISNNKTIKSIKGHRVTIKEIYKDIPEQADKDLKLRYIEHERIKIQRQIERRIKILQKLNIENQNLIE